MKKYALVTGASKGIGQAISVALSACGYDVFINYNTDKNGAKETKTLVEANGQRGYIHKGDVSNLSDMKILFEAIARRTDRLDLLVNNAGTDNDILIEDYPFDKMKRVLDVNLWGPMIVTKLALPLLKKSESGQIVNISSRMGNGKLIEGVGPYAPSKAGLIRFTKCCALEFRKYGIRANAVCPGLTDTDLNRSLFPDQNFWDEMAEKNPRGRVGYPEDVANVVSFLASDKGGYVNGEAIGVNGGSNLV
ncbi:SDR family oxidoreductase [Candidatus Dojkabacteria bacterium]|nr:SDR family oxidoreductase [Candidatus Dojkabacteria bacterium]